MPAVWSGHIVFGLVSVPVQLFPATREWRPRFHQVHAADGGRVRQPRVCELEDRVVPQEEITLGWEAPDGRMVLVTDEDLDHLPLPARKQVEVLGFIDEQDVDPIMYATPYYALPSAQAANRPYALLVETLARTGRLGVARVALRTRERLAVLRPRRGVIVVHTLWWPQDIREPDYRRGTPAPVTDRELAVAELLIGEMTGVEVDELHDEYGAALDQVIRAKLEGRDWIEPPEPAAPVDLMAALEESVRRVRRD